MVDAENYLILYLYEKKATFGLCIIWFHANCPILYINIKDQIWGKDHFWAFLHLVTYIFHI